MSRFLRRRNREEDLLLLNRLESLKLKIMEQPTNIHHPRYVKEDREDEIEAPKDNNDTIVHLEPSPEEDAGADEKFFEHRMDPYFEVSNLIVGMKLKIKYITDLLERDSSLYDSSEVINELKRLSKKCDEIENIAGMDITWV